MSKFITQIPVDFEALTKALPQSIYLHSAKLSEDRKTVDVVWDHPAFESPVAGEWEFPLQNIKDGTLPARVTLAEWARPKAQPEPAPATVVIEKATVTQLPEGTGVGTNVVAGKAEKRKK